MVTVMGGGDPSGQQRLACGAEPFDAVELAPQFTGGKPADRVGIQRGDQLAELVAEPNRRFVHVFDSTGRGGQAASVKPDLWTMRPSRPYEDSTAGSRPVTSATTAS